MHFTLIWIPSNIISHSTTIIQLHFRKNDNVFLVFFISGVSYSIPLSSFSILIEVTVISQWLWYIHVCTCVHVCGGLVFRSCLTLEIPLTGARQAPLSMGFSRQEHWSELPFPSPGYLPDPGIEPGSPVLEIDDLPTELWGKYTYTYMDC